MNLNLLNKIQNYVTEKIENSHKPWQNYHNLEHTLEVVSNSEEIAKAENLSDDDMEILYFAAWFHDIGYIDGCLEHEERSKKIAREFLTFNNYPEYKINQVTAAILTTKIPQTPQTQIEKILCDADLLHLGKKGLFKRGMLLKEEIEKNLNKQFTDEEWLKSSIEFIEKHSFHTEYVQKFYNDRKLQNLQKLRDKIELSFETINSGEEVKKKKKEIAERGIETMFRNTMRTHVSFSSMADTKANIMISVNTLILTAIVAILARKLDSNPHLIIPTIFLTLTSMSTLVFAVLVTRPKISEGKFTHQDIENKKANLLFFGNFFQMKLDDFMWGMKEVISDRDYLYDSMIKDFYFLGQVLGKKYKYLRICYNIFLFGILLSVLAFIISIIIAPQPTDMSF